MIAGLATGLWLVVVVGAAPPPITAVAFAPDGRAFLSGSQAGVEVRDWPQQRLRDRLESQLVNVHDLEFSPDGSRLATAGGAPAEDGVIELFSWPERTLLRRVRLQKDLVYDVAWDSNSSTLAAASLDGTVVLYDADEDRVIRSLPGHSRGVLAVEFVADSLLVSAGLDQTLRVWNLATGELVRTLDNHTRPVHDIAVRPQQPDGALPLIASAGEDRTVRLWQPTIGRMVRFVRFDSAVPLAIQWMDGGRRLAVACSDGHIRVIDPDTAQIENDGPVLNGLAYCLRLHPSGRGLLVGGRSGLARHVLGE